MRRRTQTTLALGVALAALLGMDMGCVHVGEDPLPEIIKFDPTTGEVPQPTILVINPETGLIDLSLAGIDVPEDCSTLPATAVAQCEFNQYLETLDGFPTTLGASAPSSAPLDMATVTVPDNLLVLDESGGGIMPPESLSVTFDATDDLLRIIPNEGWEVGRTYVVAVRGYGDGVKAADGSDIVADVVFYLLRQPESLTCGAVTADDISDDCKFYELLVQQDPEHPDEVRANLVALEQTRQMMESAGLWDALDLFGIPRDEVAVSWAFPIHTASVAELQPAMGMLPEVRSSSQIFIPVKGTLDASSLTRFSLGQQDGTVFLLDLTALAAGNVAGGLPEFEPTSTDGGILLTAQADLTDGDLYCIILKNTITNQDDQGLVPSPTTVLLRTRGILVDDQGHSTVAGVSDADATALEAGRLQLAELLDNEQFIALTGLEREDIAYIYAFTFPNPASN